MHKLFRRITLSISVSTSALLTLVIGLGLTALLFASARRLESERYNAEFQQNAKLRTAAVASGLRDAVEQLMVLNQLFSTVGVISHEQFRVFATPLVKRYPEIQALSFRRRIMQRDRRAYEMAMRRTYPDFTITELVSGRKRPAATRDSYDVVEYIAPMAGNEAVLGLDMAVMAGQTQARLRSRATGRMVATDLVSLAQYAGWHTGVVVLAPVYRQGVALDTVAARHRAVIGETAAIFQIDHLINTLLDASGFLDIPGMSISIYASPKADVKKLAFRHGTVPHTEIGIPLIPRWLIYNRAEPVSQSLDLGGNPWHMHVSQSASPFTAIYGGSLYALLGGIFSSVLAAAYVYSLVSRATTIRRVTSERTAALHFDNLRLSEEIALRRHSEKFLRLRERVIEGSANATIICSAVAPDYAIEYVNPAFERLIGHNAADLIGRNLGSLQRSYHDQQTIEEIRTVLREKREGRAMLRNLRKDGSSRWNDLYIGPVRDENGVISHFVVVQYDVTEIKRYEAELQFQANYDNLTGLANRSLLRKRLNQAIAGAKPNCIPIWVVFIDLDRFKFVNDTLGHEAGDEVLKALSGRLQSTGYVVDTVARVGGDEFVVVLPEPTDYGSGLAILQEILDTMAQPLVVQEHEFVLTCSIGVAKFPTDGSTAEELIKHADIAMYRAKEIGRNTSQFYATSMNDRTLDRLTIEPELRHALERNEFSLHYQPQVDICTGRMIGMEALLRWNHPLLGPIPPARFIGLAEEMGLIIPIGAWVLHTACAQTKAWQQAGLGNLRVAVNLSPRQFTQKALAQSIADILDATGLEPCFLELELTENMVMSDVDNVIPILRDLKALGVNISIDDFGTGYSSLSYLRRFPIDVLKIDQSFVNDLADDADAAAIVIAIISLAHSLRLQVIAEGVETAEQLTFLRTHGCDQVQGYYFSRPIASDAFERMLIDAAGAVGRLATSPGKMYSAALPWSSSKLSDPLTFGSNT
ncbi:MAG: hypothetical protein JWQ23_2014 [Herminiimonas sp.]|nr:hypothetical protein [Herminiimonas sp.]